MSLGLPDDSFKEQVRSSTDLVRLVSESVSLQPRRGGAEYAGLCPFHDDHNPSMVVYPERGTFRCWSCDKGGDCFSWVQEIESVGFREALEILARRAHLEIPRSQARRSDALGDRPKLYDVLEWAEDQFHRFLLNAREAEVARDYLYDRGFTDETIVEFRLGFHPDNWQWLLERARGKHELRELLAARLVRERSGGNGCHDYFINRVMFPIHDEGGRTVAFGGRILPGSKDSSKYFNSVGSDVFPKQRMLYALDRARDSIRKSRQAIVVEGYTDCIMCHQFGISNVVATLGTALTENHVISLKRRSAERVVLIYDGDAAGQKAAEGSLPKLIAYDIGLRILTLPNDLDPAGFLAARGTDEFARLINEAPEAWEFKLCRLETQHDKNSVQGASEIIRGMTELLAAAPGLANRQRDLLIGRLAQRFRIDERTIRREVDELRRRGTSFGASAKGSTHADAPVESTTSVERTADGTRIAEEDVLGGLFDDPARMAWIRSQIGSEDFARGPRRELFELCIDLAEQGVAPCFHDLTATLEDTELKRLATLIHDQLQEKKRHEHALDEAASAECPSVPVWLSHAIEFLKSKRRAIANEQSKTSIAGATGPLSSDQIEALRRIADTLADHHRSKRAS